MRTAKLLASAITSIALIATPVMAAPSRSAAGLSMTGAVAGAPLRAGADVRKSEELRKGGAWLFALMGAAIITTLALTLGKDGKHISAG